MISYEAFRRNFNFSLLSTVFYDPRVGVEREAFVCDLRNKLVPQSSKLLEVLGVSMGDQITPELSACQIEVKSKPLRLGSLAATLVAQEQELRDVAKALGLQLRFEPVAPIDMPFDVYPLERYQRIAEEIPRSVLVAACRVAGTHVHVEVNESTALLVYNDLVEEFDDWLELAGGYHSERMSLYRQVTDKWRPIKYETWSDLYRHACDAGFAEDLRNWWSLIRLTSHGTIEFRMFDSTASTAEICTWAQKCVSRCVDLHEKHTPDVREPAVHSFW